MIKKTTLIALTIVLTLLHASFVNATFWVTSEVQGTVHNFDDDGALNFYVELTDSPGQMELDPKTGNAAVLIPESQEIIIVSPAGEILVNVGPYRVYDPKLTWPHDVAFDPEGNLWIADEVAVVKLDPLGFVILKIQGPTGVLSPKHVVYSSYDNSIWVLGISELVKYDLQGREQLRIGGFDHPEGMSINTRDGSVAVADTDNEAVQVFSSEGYLLTSITRGLRMPKDVSFDNQGNIWIINTLDRKIMKFNKRGTLVTDIINGEIGVPTQITLDPRTNTLYVVDKEQLWILDPAAPRGKMELVRQFDQPVSDVELDIGAESMFVPPVPEAPGYQPRPLQDLRATSAAVLRREVSSQSAKPVIAQPAQPEVAVPTSAAVVSVPQTVPVASEESEALATEVQQLRQQVAEQQQAMNDVLAQRAAPTASAPEKKSSELMGVLVITFVILLILAFIGGMMLKRRRKEE